jgi:S-adenosylmethionine decarboxylase
MKTIDHSMDYGNHIILDLHQCNENKLYFSDHNILATIDYIVKSNNGTIESSNYHIFPNDAYTVMILLSESHLTIHTFPENKYVSVDVYTCGSSVLTFNIATNIIQYFESEKSVINHIIRNNFNNCPELKYNANDYIVKKDGTFIVLSNVVIIYNKKNITVLMDGDNEKYILVNNTLYQEIPEDIINNDVFKFFNKCNKDLT